ncbi:hypothetical protein EDB80DRAFT_212764 [Ilyonectria destructans]|nr:hypothetical protein EDB80DRAFT_212764 [Ilyonectria destructans]
MRNRESSNRVARWLGRWWANAMRWTRGTVGGEGHWTLHGTGSSQVEREMRRGIPFMLGVSELRGEERMELDRVKVPRCQPPEAIRSPGPREAWRALEVPTLASRGALQVLGWLDHQGTRGPPHPSTLGPCDPDQGFYDPSIPRGHDIERAALSQATSAATPHQNCYCIPKGKNNYVKKHVKWDNLTEASLLDFSISAPTAA